MLYTLLFQILASSIHLLLLIHHSSNKQESNKPDDITVHQYIIFLCFFQVMFLYQFLLDPSGLSLMFKIINIVLSCFRSIIHCRLKYNFLYCIIKWMKNIQLLLIVFLVENSAPEMLIGPYNWMFVVVLPNTLSASPFVALIPPMAYFCSLVE
jgi:hypothetical protein